MELMERPGAVAAVQAAEKLLWDRHSMLPENSEELIRSALEAALPVLDAHDLRSEARMDPRWNERVFAYLTEHAGKLAVQSAEAFGLGVLVDGVPVQPDRVTLVRPEPDVNERAGIIEWLRSDEAGRIAAGAAGDPWYIAGRLADALEGDEQRRAPAAGGGSGARARAGAEAGGRAGEPDGLLGEAITRHVYAAIQEAGEMVPAGVEEGAERALRELWDRGVLVGPEEEWPFVHYCRSSLREIDELLSVVDGHGAFGDGKCSDCAEAVRQARDFAVRTLAETVPAEVERGEDPPALLVLTGLQLKALRELTSGEAHVCTCGGGDGHGVGCADAFVDRCRFEVAVRELVERVKCA